MRKWVLIGFAAVALAGGGYVAYKLKARATNHTFEKGQCTWYALERANEAGWKIMFDHPYGRHARYWPERVLNAKLVSNPAAGELMILGDWPGNPYGHVAYVEKVTDRDHWTVSHANMGVGTNDRTLDGQTIRVATVTRTKSGLVFSGRRETYPLIGFLAPTGG